MSITPHANSKINQAIDRQKEIFPNLKTNEIESLRKNLQSPVILFDTDKGYIVMADQTGAIKVGSESVNDVIGVLLESFAPDLSGVVTSADSVLTGIEKLQGQITGISGEFPEFEAFNNVQDSANNQNYFQLSGLTFTATKAGTYLVETFINSALDATPHTVSLAIYKNAAVQAETVKSHVFRNNGIYSWHHFRATIPLVVDDIVTIFMKRDTAGAASLTVEEKYLHARRIS